MRRLAGRALALGALAAIAWLTLMPQPADSHLRIPVTCVVCGTNGGADVVANVLLFIPLGLGLGLAGVRGRTAWLAGSGVSLAVELLQLFLVTGRFGTLSDLLTNSLGTLIGVAVARHPEWWLRPDRRVARRLAIGGAAAWLAGAGLASWATARRVDPAGYTPMVDETEPRLPWFEGSIDTAIVHGTVVAHRGTGPVVVAAPVGPRFEASISAVGADHRAQFVPLLFVHPRGDTAATFVLGVRGRDAVLATALRGRRAHLRGVPLVIRGAIPAAGEPPTRYTVAGAVNGSSLRLAVRTARGTRSATLRLGPAIAWATLTGIPAVDAPIAPFVSAVWLWSPAILLGYWIWRARASS